MPPETTNNSRQIIEFFWDAVSPFTYLAATQLDKFAAETGCEIHWRPFFLGGVFQATDNKAPATVPAKGRYMFKDLRRWAKRYGEPFHMPTPFPVNSIHAMRAAVVADQAGKGPEFGMELMRRFFTDSGALDDPQTLAAVAQAVGLDARQIAEQIQHQAIKDTLRDNTEEAVQRGAFGAPTFFIGEDMFWGNDRFDLMRDHLNQA